MNNKYNLDVHQRSVEGAIFMVLLRKGSIYCMTIIAWKGLSSSHPERLGIDKYISSERFFIKYFRFSVELLYEFSLSIVHNQAT